MANPKVSGLAVPRIKEVPAVEIAAWVIGIINTKSTRTEQRIQSRLPISVN
jgi:hypothetical protein